MPSTNRSYETSLLVAIAIIMTLAAVGSAAATPGVSKDGWHTWRVDATADAPNWCCYVWRHDTPVQKACDLDEGNHGFTSSQGDNVSPEEIKIYARMKNGEPYELRALSDLCPVTSKSNVIDHGKLAQTDSVAWLSEQIVPRGRIASEALAAIAVHAGDEARRMLVATARSATSMDNRKDAVFWMGQARARETRHDLRWLMFNDPSEELREHSAFSWSQSNIANRGEALRELGMTDASDKVRGQAWFWLAQTGDPQSEAAILEAIVQEDSRKTRNQAIFALSQLPEPRSVDALIAVIENHDLRGKDRKQALFWLAQSSSDSALDYLAKVLD